MSNQTFRFDYNQSVRAVKRIACAAHVGEGSDGFVLGRRFNSDGAEQYLVLFPANGPNGVHCEVDELEAFKRPGMPADAGSRA